MTKKMLFTGLMAMVALAFMAKTGEARGSFPGIINATCGTSYSCDLCHPGGNTSVSPDSSDTNAWDFNTTRDPCIYCPDVCGGPTCLDGDGDGFGSPGDPSCPNGGATDCDDSDSNVSPAAIEDCTNGIDDDCDNLIDAQDPGAVGCPPVCTDVDGDGFAAEGGRDCGPADCDDTVFAVNPGADEDCGNGIDDDCDGFVDGDDPDCGGCVPTARHEKGKKCSDGIDNDCNGLTDADDPSCWRGKVTGDPEVCDDGSDNDLDGKIDCADKKDCGKSAVCAQ